jgi:hypothetical protein
MFGNMLDFLENHRQREMLDVLKICYEGYGSFFALMIDFLEVFR